MSIAPDLPSAGPANHPINQFPTAIVERDPIRLTQLLTGVGLGALTGLGLGLALGPAGSGLRVRVAPLLAEAAEHPEMQRLIASVAERFGVVS